MERRNGINFKYWSKVSTIEIWESAAMMWGVDPRALSTGNVVDRNGNFPDLADQERLLMSAVRAGQLAASDDGAGVAPHRHTHVLAASLIAWFRQNGYVDLAHGLELAGVSGVSPALTEARRRLADLRALGGDCAFDRMDGKWKITGLKALRDQEVGKGHRRADAKTLRGDLRMAAEAERETHRHGRPQGVLPGRQ